MKGTHTLQLEDEAATEALAIRLATRSLKTGHFEKGLVMAFSGEIGAGKTTFIRAMLRALGIKSAIKSPTFSLVETYVYNNLQIHHFDLYRIQEASELEYLGFRDFFSNNALCCIEWPEHAQDQLAAIDLHFRLKLEGTGRKLQVCAFTTVGLAVLSCLDG